LAFPALFFLVRARSPISKNYLVKSGVSSYIDARTVRDVEGIRRSGYTVVHWKDRVHWLAPDCDGAFPMDELSDTKIRNATPTDKEYAIADGQGLSVRGSAQWDQAVALPLPFRRQAQKYVFWHLSGVGLKAARAKRTTQKKLLDQGQDPVAVREAKRKEDEKLKHTFRASGKNGRHELENENKAKSTIKRERWISLSSS